MERLIADPRELHIALTDRHLAALETCYRELVAWNQRFNLTAITDREGVLVRHFLDSLSGLKALPRAELEAGARVTVILTTHDPNTAAAVADQVVLMRRGGAVVVGPAEATLNAEYLSATYGLPVEVTYVRGRPVILAL